VFLSTSFSRWPSFRGTSVRSAVEDVSGPSRSSGALLILCDMQRAVVLAWAFALRRISAFTVILRRSVCSLGFMLAQPCSAGAAMNMQPGFGCAAYTEPCASPIVARRVGICVSQRLDGLDGPALEAAKGRKARTQIRAESESESMTRWAWQGRFQGCFALRPRMSHRYMPRPAGGTNSRSAIAGRAGIRAHSRADRSRGLRTAAGVGRELRIIRGDTLQGWCKSDASA